MIYNFTEFLYERMGFPDVIEPYYEVIYDKIKKLLEGYYNRKGKLANYKTSEEITYDEIRQFVDDETFRKFPIEKIRLDFYIKIVKDVEKISYDATYFGQSYRRNPEGETFYIDSDSGLVEKALDIKMEFAIKIPRNIEIIKSTDIDKIMLDNITHELFHAYDEFNKKKKKLSWGGTWGDIRETILKDVKLKKMMKSDTIYNFLWWLYTIEDEEVRANIASLGLMKFDTLLDLKKSTVWKDYAGTEFDAESEAEDAKKELKKECGDEAEYYYDNFGKILIQKYKEFTRNSRIERDNKILSLEDKNLLEVFKFFEAKIHEVCDMVKRKISKLVGNYKIEEE